MHFKRVLDPQIKKKINEIREDVENFVVWIFQHHVDCSRAGSKVIHDGVWGTNSFENFEIALINTPLIQRLRQIHQTAYTYLTYPSTQHTRFEHTLGVTTQVGKLFRALRASFKSLPKKKKKKLIDDKLYTTLRAASILHDCGHGPLSHSTEEIYQNFKEIRLLKKYDPFKQAEPSEILSYLILDTVRFKHFLRKVKKKYRVPIDEDLMKNAIVGYTENPLDRYKIDILHGPFDADKLDYLFRDGHFSGLPLQVDLDRLWYSLAINKVHDEQRLTINWGGVCSLEQILFSKMTLYPLVYHHHKVRTCDCMCKGIIEYIKEKKPPLRENNININFNKATHFLYFTDPDIFNIRNISKNDEDLHMLIHNLQFRRLLKRAIVIARDTIKAEDKLDRYIKYREEPTLVEGLEYYRWLAKKIWEKAGNPGLLQEIWVDCPEGPDFEEANDTWISPLGEGQKPTPLADFFKTDQYTIQYKHKKWRSHVFCNPKYISKITKACVSVFKKECGIEFKPLAFYLCHNSPPSNL